MTRHFRILGVVLVGALAVAAGCSPQQPFYFFEDGDMSHYVGKATEIEFPDVETASLDDVTGAIAPLTLDNPDPSEIWELTLEEAVQIALANSKVIRQLPSPGFTPRVLSAPDGAPSVYDPALQETSNGFARPIGVAAALADFDANLDSFVRWQRNDQQANVGGFGAFVFSTVRVEELGSFQAQLRKTAATGATWYLRHNVNYSGSNSPIRAEPSDWDVSLEAEFSQPLLQGSGVQFTRIYGPRQTSVAGVSPFGANRSPETYRGVMIARINTDISLTEFESQVRNLVNDVERGYWDLYLAYRNVHTLKEGRDRSLDTWRKLRARLEVGEANIQEESQARHQYYEFRGALENGLSALYTQESNLRYVLGLAPTDGRLIRPADEPTEADIKFDYYESHAEAMVRSVDLRRQKWQIKKRELELIAAKNLMLPELNAGGIYRWRGLGDDLIDSSNSRDNAFAHMTGGDFQEWALGLSFSMPLGFRKALAGVRNAQLRLTRDRVVLQEQELAVTHQLQEALRNLERNYILAQTRFNQLRAAQRELRGRLAEEEVGRQVLVRTVDLILDAQRRVAVAEVNYFSALVEYNKAIAQVHLLKGSLLEYNGVYLAEGPWPPKAYFDATRRARARDASFYLDYGFTRPKVISRGPYEQHAGQAGPMLQGEGLMFEGGSMLEEISPPEEIPLGTPVPSDEVPGGPLKPTPDANTLLRRVGPEGADRAVVATTGRFRPAGPSDRSSSGGNGSGYDIAATDLALFARGPSAAQEASSAAASPVRQVSYEQVLPAGDRGESPPPQSGWKSSSRPGRPDESAGGSRASKPDGYASGWTSAKR